MTWVLSLLARKWLIIGVVAAFTAWSGIIAWKVYSVTSRNLTAYYGGKISELQVENTKLVKTIQDIQRKSDALNDRLKKIRENAPALPELKHDDRVLYPNSKACRDCDG